MDTITTVEMASIVLSILVIPALFYIWRMEQTQKEIVNTLQEIKKDQAEWHKEQREYHGNTQKEQRDFHVQHLNDHRAMMEKHIEMYSKIQTRWDTEKK